MKRQKITIAAALLLLAAVSASCGNEAAENPDEAPASQNAAEAVTEAVPETKIYSEQLTFTDYGGEEFRIYTSNNINGLTYPTTLNHGEEETGEVVNDALFARDRWMEDKYNVKMVYDMDETTAAAQMAKKLSKIIMAGDPAHDLIIQDIAQVAKGLISENCVYPLSYIDTINLDADYWMPSLNNDLRLAGDLYYSASVVSPRFYGSVYVIQFNRDIAAELDMEDLYATVQEGKWTIDKMYTLSRDAVSDMDGDGKMTVNDRFGMIYEVLTPEAMVLGAGMHYVQNVNGELKSMLDDPKLITLMQEMAAFLGESCVTYDGSTKVDANVLLSNGNYLFRNPCTFDLASYRDLPYDYGILPMPKLDEAQKEYYAYTQPWATACPVIPITVTGGRLSMTGTLTDAMAAYGYDYIRPAVFDNVIQLKGTRDERSGQIIDMVFENVTFELSTILKFGNLYTTTTTYFTTGLGKKDITTMWAAEKEKSAVEIEKIMTQLADFKAELNG